MGKISKLSYAVLIIIIAGLCIAIYSSTSSGNQEKNQKDKALSEIEYLEGKIETLLNKLNNIDVRNYNVSVSEISKQQQEQQNKSKSNEGKEESGSGSSSSSSSNTNSQQETGRNSQENETIKKYEMVKNGVLLESSKVDWDNIKSEIEILYSSIPTITLDLYQIDVSKDDIIGFNKEFDKLVIVVKDENKDEVGKSLALLYEYIFKFTQKATDDEITKKLAEVKAHMFKAYTRIETKKWEEIKNETKEVVRVYNELFSNSSVETNKQYSISKGYVMVNELQSAADEENETAYLIKYKNLLEEINNL